jgi:hypothetical protein
MSYEGKVGVNLYKKSGAGEKPHSKVVTAHGFDPCAVRFGVKETLDRNMDRD